MAEGSSIYEEKNEILIIQLCLINFLNLRCKFICIIIYINKKVLISVSALDMVELKFHTVQLKNPINSVDP
ncbi:hypothetical protein BA171_06255 [Candidatus Hamiltonella defensa (Bemisia tabaci)]|uniref:Uncharacterized protein n=1 Tax=Candidatus Hamiltonella defensa (Bemisia tabaci) TaxID=672795 RepID=A0A249E0F1_9ENTR|nr:hypothetical protein BA171_06255 [Candidatus Hamiltonella defensa (Bemisia tabaci)]